MVRCAHSPAVGSGLLLCIAAVILRGLDLLAAGTGRLERGVGFFVCVGGDKSSRPKGVPRSLSEREAHEELEERQRNLTTETKSPQRGKQKG